MLLLLGEALSLEYLWSPGMPYIMQFLFQSSCLLQDITEACLDTLLSSQHLCVSHGQELSHTVNDLQKEQVCSLLALDLPIWRRALDIVLYLKLIFLCVLC